MSLTVPESHRQIARAMRDAFGGTPKVTTYWDDDHHSSVAILSAQGSPHEDVTSFGTIGVSDLPIVRGGKEFPARVEVVGACYSSSDEAYARIIASVAFFVINSGWVPLMGRVLPRLLTMYPDLSTPQSHILLVAPNLWDDRLLSLRMGDRMVAWLQAVAISDAEWSFLDEHGLDALEDKFVEENVDILNLSRPSIF